MVLKNVPSNGVPEWLNWLSAWLLIFAQVIISGFWDWALHWVLCWVGSLLFFQLVFSFFQRPLTSIEWRPFIYLAFTFLHVLNPMDPISHVFLKFFLVSFKSPYSGLSTKWLKWLRTMSPYLWLCGSANNLTQDYPSWRICCSSPQENNSLQLIFFSPIVPWGCLSISPCFVSVHDFMPSFLFTQEHFPYPLSSLNSQNKSYLM